MDRRFHFVIEVDGPNVDRARMSLVRSVICGKDANVAGEDVGFVHSDGTVHKYLPPPEGYSVLDATIIRASKNLSAFFAFPEQLNFEIKDLLAYAETRQIPPDLLRWQDGDGYQIWVPVTRL